MSTTNRLVDYFALTGVNSSSNSSRLVLAEEARLPTTTITTKEDESSLLNCLSFKSCILDRYPSEDYSDSPLSQELALFCLPDGVKVDNYCHMPSFFTFVLTGGDGHHVYGANLLFYEMIEDENHLHCIETIMEEMKQSIPTVTVISNSELSDIDTTIGSYESSKENRLNTISSDKQQQPYMNKKKTLYITKSICILSHYPMHFTFKTFLSELYRLSISPCKLPIERYIQNFTKEVPLPPLGKIQVQYTIGTQTILVKRPPENELPLSDISYEQIFKALSVDNILFLIHCILNERQILFHSKNYSLLGTVTEGLCSLIFPFHWHHVFIPLLPKQCLEFICAPVPYIMGTRSEFLYDLQIPNEVVRVDLDRNEIVYKSKLPVIPLPDKQLTKLKNTLMSYVQDKRNNHEEDHTNLDMAYNLAPMPDEIGDISLIPKRSFSTNEVRMAFLRVFISLFQKYKQYLRTDVKLDNPMNFEVPNHFRKAAFIKDRQSESAKQFFRVFFDTQAFQRFLLTRVMNENVSQIKFFDESIQAKTNRSRLKLYKIATPFLNDTSLKISNTVVAIQPDGSNVPEHTFYIYPLFPQLNVSRFGEIREVKQLVSMSECRARQCDTILASWKTILATLSSLAQQVIHTEESRLKLLKSQYKKNSFKGKPQQQTPPPPHRRNLVSEDFDVDSDKSSTSTSVTFAGAPLYLDMSCSSCVPPLSLFTKFNFECRDVCPHCNYELSDSNIKMGWSSSSQEYRTTCPTCLTKFVPRFCVLINNDDNIVESTPSDFDSVMSASLNESTPSEHSPAFVTPPVTPTPTPTATPSAKLFKNHSRVSSSSSFSTYSAYSSLNKIKYEYLSPVVLKKEVENLLNKDVCADEKLFTDHPLIFWNLIVQFRDLSIPLNFLLPQVDWKHVLQSLAELRGTNTTVSEVERKLQFAEKSQEEVPESPYINA
jgi:hypothetical protein